MCRDGSVIPVLLNATTVKDDNGKFLMSRTTFFDITEARKARSELMEKNRELNDALSKVKLLSGLLPICASCKKIRDDDGYWNSVEKYIGEHSEAAFTHSICPDCARRLYPEFYDK
ncbi:MAG TPA: PAS domain-containing protein [Syntrophales bacterium]|nr:PAS domain-containing protein [Syntrophales bacterium]